MKKPKQDNFFERTPFNFCDRWCERCNLHEKCRVFQDEYESRLKHIMKGEDPDDWEIIFQDIRESFRKTAELIKKDIEKGELIQKNLKKKLKKKWLKRKTMIGLK